MNSTRHTDEVRRCARCGAATLVCARAWELRVAGIRTGSWTLDFACRSCGAEVTLHPEQKIRAERLLAFLTLPAIFPSVFFFASARRRARAWSDNPVVSEGPAAPLQREEPARVCAACQGTAHCTEIRRSSGMSLGTRFRFMCSRCATAFTVHDDRAVVFSGFLASVLSAAGTLVVVFPPGSAVGAEASNRWFGVAVLILAATSWVSLAHQIRARRAHPLVS